MQELSRSWKRVTKEGAILHSGYPSCHCVASASAAYYTRSDESNILKPLLDGTSSRIYSTAYRVCDTPYSWVIKVRVAVVQKVRGKWLDSFFYGSVQPPTFIHDG